MVSFEDELKMLLKTGKVMFGSKKAIKAAMLGKAKMIIIAENVPPNIRRDIEHYAKLSGIPIYVFKGTSVDLGTLCGRPHVIAAITVLDPGDSNIMDLVAEE